MALTRDDGSQVTGAGLQVDAAQDHPVLGTRQRDSGRRDHRGGMSGSRAARGPGGRGEAVCERYGSRSCAPGAASRNGALGAPTQRCGARTGVAPGVERADYLLDDAGTPE